jgi:mono/diheme cytochrome c family protein
LIRKGRVTIGGVGLAAIATVVLLSASGCGYGPVASAAGHPDVQNGQKLFPTTCGGCHALQAAGTSGNPAIPAPDLDNAFAAARKEGFSVSSIENVVLDQIRLGSGPIATYTNPEHGVKGLTPVPVSNTMRPNILTGQDALDVAAYVASVAGINGFVKSCNLAGAKTGDAVFGCAGCAGCHTLKAAGSKGTIGPNLDTLAKVLTVAIVARQVTNGGAVMPPFKTKLTAAQIQAVAKYVSSVAGKK